MDEDEEAMLRLEDGQFGLKSIVQLRPIKDVEAMDAVVYQVAANEDNDAKSEQWHIRIDEGSFDQPYIAEALITDVTQAHEAGKWLIALLRARQ